MSLNSHYFNFNLQWYAIYVDSKYCSKSMFFAPLWCFAKSCLLICVTAVHSHGYTWVKRYKHHGYICLCFLNLFLDFQFGHIVLTTSAGIMDHDEARRKNVGGKVLGFFY